MQEGKDTKGPSCRDQVVCSLDIHPTPLFPGYYCWTNALISPLSLVPHVHLLCTCLLPLRSPWCPLLIHTGLPHWPSAMLALLPPCWGGLQRRRWTTEEEVDHGLGDGSWGRRWAMSLHWWMVTWTQSGMKVSELPHPSQSLARWFPSCLSTSTWFAQFACHEIICYSGFSQIPLLHFKATLFLSVWLQMHTKTNWGQ